MRKFNELEWDEFNIYKNAAKHGVQYWEVEEAFENHFILLKSKVRKSIHKEKRMCLLGKTDEGRYIFVVFEPKSRQIARPISFREMTESERRYYDKKIR